MPGRNYEREEIEAFGTHLLESKDLDPIYVALADAGFPNGQLRRWLVAYWCWYSAGAACWLSERKGDEFWAAMRIAARNESPTPTGGRWPRGHERRHARGKQGVTMVEKLAERYGNKPELMVDFCANGGSNNSCRQVMRRVGEHYLFGRWIGFKIADMTERVLGIPVSFDAGEIFMFNDPVKAVFMLAKWRQKIPFDGKDIVTKLDSEGWLLVRETVAELTEFFSECDAPPHMDRPIGLQEVETILCKWKSHLNGHYPRYNDIDEILTGLTSWMPHSKAARRFYKVMPKKPGWESA